MYDRQGTDSRRVEHALDHPSFGKLVPNLIDCAPYLNGSDSLSVVLTLTLATGQDEKGSAMSFPDQPVALCFPIKEPDALSACRYEGQTLTVETTAGQRFEVNHELMEI